MRQVVVLLVGLVLCGGYVNAQVGRELEKAKAKNNIIGITEKEDSGEKFVLVTTDEKGSALESWFLDGVCVYARWLSRGGGEPDQEYKEMIWGINFPKEKVVRKDERSWQGQNGNSISWSKTKEGLDVMSVTTKKMDDITRLEALRRYEKSNEKGDAQKNPAPSKNSERDSQSDKTGNTLTYDQAIERYGLPQAEKNLASGRIVSQWEKRQGISGQGQSGYGSGGGWQHISGGETLVMVCTFNDKGVLEKQTFNFSPTFGGEESKRRRCERYFILK